MVRQFLRPIPKFAKDWLNLWLLLICLAAWQNDPASNLWRLFFVAGGIVNAYALVARRRGGITYVRKEWRKMTHVAVGWKEVPSDDSGRKKFIRRWKAAAPETEFVFYGLGIPVPVGETLLLRFMKIAKRRQNNALYRGGLVWTGEGYKTIRLNWVLSEEHFTKRVSPRFPEDEYCAILIILGYSRLMTGGRRQGSSGRLIGDYSPQRYVEIAIHKWIVLTSPPPRSGLMARGRRLFN